MKVCVLGAGGFIGKNLLRDTDWVGVTRQELDLTDLGAVEKYFEEYEYDVVIHCAVIGGSRLKPDNGEVFYKNILMFESVARAFKGRILYFSSGAALRGDPPTDPYGLSKRLIEHRIDTIPNAHVLRIWGCYGPGELPTRFSAVCKREGHVVIDQDRYFDFIDIEDVKKMVEEYVSSKWEMPKVCNLVYPEKLLLSQWAERFGATWEVKDPSSLGESYTSVPP
jgi:nucleoside-diphosphate-sugar epimerase